MPLAWTVIIPVKGLDRAKTRLVSGAAGPIAFAFFQDALAAVQSTPRVATAVVATSDPVVAEWARARGAVVVDDSATDGINSAAAHARRSVGAGGPTAVLVSDLPCLTPTALDAVLAVAGDHATSFLRDADGTGTTIWMTTAPAGASQFGPDSAALHAASGAADLVIMCEPSLLAPARRDVDTADDLRAARVLGAGPHTTAVIGRPTVVTVAAESVVASGAAVPVVDEDGRSHEVPSEVLVEAGFRLVRVGQRLVVDLGPNGSSVVARLP